ncbi:hypothetical protein M446_6114 [Methylobacterium sp. 4-46]|uniref:hypothetical protein n=1 Tax=Methylobacterium sp. (strain 4-46) TaxID=426117 RepID=UPI000165CD68|nr:hypothetical protein [Methylobacterium sp. 4-46]ACA20390.1 hypothetical protein M446_6114 [Methylobacterium sp. 4-46]
MTPARGRPGAITIPCPAGRRRVTARRAVASRPASATMGGRIRVERGRRMSGTAGRRAVLVGLGAGLAGRPARARPGDAPPFVLTGIPDPDESRLVARFGRAAAPREAGLGAPARSMPVRSDPAVTAFTTGPVQPA